MKMSADLHNILESIAPNQLMCNQNMIFFSGLKNDIRELKMKIKEQEHSLDSKDQLAKRLEIRSAGMVAENAELSANLVEVRQRLESEVRIRESRAAKQVKKILLDAGHLRQIDNDRYSGKNGQGFLFH